MNCLIAQTGKQIECAGGVHHIICRLQLGITLRRFFKSGGVRVKIHHDLMAVEFYGQITDEQNRIINRLLREQPIYTVIMPTETVTKFRPIRHFDFKGCLTSV